MRILKSMILGAGLMLATAGVANAIQYDLGTGGDAGTLTAGVGNSLTITQNGHLLTVTAWYDNGTDTLDQATLGRYSPGLGVCSSGESCSSSPVHAVDNNGNNDWVLFVLDTVVTFDSVFLDDFGEEYDNDVDWFVGTYNFGTIDGKKSSLSNVDGLGSLAGILGLTSGTSSGTGGDDRTVSNLGTGNFLLIGAREFSSPGYADNNDYFKIKTLKVTVTVPEPATWSLMIVAFAAMAMFYRRRQAAA